MDTIFFPKLLLCPKIHRWLVLQLFFPLVLASICATGNGTNGARAAAATPTAAAPERAGLPLPPLAKDCKSLGLVQVGITPGRTHSEEEEEPIGAKREEKKAEEETTVEAMEEEDSLQAGQQPVPKSALLGTAMLKLNHTAGHHGDNNTSRGLQLQVPSRISASDVNSSTAPVPFSSHRSRLNMWIGLRQLSASLHSRVILPLRHVAAASMRTGGTTSWVLLLVGALGCVCLCGAVIASNAGAMPSKGTTLSVGKTPTGSLRQPQKSPGYSASQNYIPTRPQAPPWSTTSIDATPMGRISTMCPTRQISLPPSLLPSSTSLLQQDLHSGMGDARTFLCPELVVPSNCESFLFVPLYKPMVSFFVKDVDGNNVLQVELQMEQERRYRAVLKGSDRLTLAQCVPSQVDGEFQLLDANGKHFATLVEDDLDEELMHSPRHGQPLTRWIMGTPAGVKWYFHGRCDDYAVEARDHHGRIVALAQPSPETFTREQLGNAVTAYLLRVAPLMDVSIALCGILAVNHLL